MRLPFTSKPTHAPESLDPELRHVLEADQEPADLHAQPGLSLFWRTFFLLGLLLLSCILAWLQTLRSLETEPRAILKAQQIASLVNLSRAALIHSDAIARVSLLKTISEQEGVRILPREPADTYALFHEDKFDRRIAQALTQRLGPGTVVAEQVNQQPGLWVGFGIDRDNYWMLLDRTRFDHTGSETWLLWLFTAAALSLAGAALIARLINRPLNALSFAASRVREGDFAASQLDERAVTSEIRQVNIGFNRMAQRLAKIEQDRAVMLAGISHDLRTPLARLRLETEMSVSDSDAKSHMVADIEQLDAIIDKFLDYARPNTTPETAVRLEDIIHQCTYAFTKHSDMHIQLDLESGLKVKADEVELGRVISNLLENARRYGKSADDGIAHVQIASRSREDWVLLKLRDHGSGVDPEHLPHLTKPFFRSNAARTEATGAGLGLSIVEKSVRQMGGKFALANNRSGGLSAFIKLHRAQET